MPKKGITKQKVETAQLLRETIGKLNNISPETFHTKTSIQLSQHDYLGSLTATIYFSETKSA